ncbi:MAG: ADOP family duplicated permease [Terriglobia bacterium]
MWTEFTRRLAMLFRGRHFDADLEEEMRLHRELREREQIEAGVAWEKARCLARRRFGNDLVLREESRDMWGWSWLEGTLKDVRYGFRMLTKNPGFAAVAVLSLALGIGANTAIFTLINDVLLKSLPVRDPQQLVSFGKAYGAGVIGGLDPGPFDLFPYDFYEQIKSDKEGFQGVCAFASFTTMVSVRPGGSSQGPAERAISRLVSGNYFAVLGVNTILGREISPSDAEVPGRSPVAVISYRYWQRKFSGDPGVLGKSILVNATPFTVIGVAPAGFFGESVDTDPPEMWLPLTMQPQVTLRPSLIDPHGPYWLHLIGRRGPGPGLKQAQEWVNLRLRQYLVEQQGANLTPKDKTTIQHMYLELLPGAAGDSNLRVEYSEPLEILMGVVVLVLLITCANLANLLLARAIARQKELSTRLALGAGRWRIIRQILTETLLLSGLGGVLGLAFAVWGTRSLINFVAGTASYIPLDPIPDVRVLAFTLGVCLLTGIFFGLAPALRVSRASLASSLKERSRTMSGSSGGHGRIPLPKILVASQVALSLLLLVGAGLFVRTLRNLAHQDFGFNRSNILLVTIDPHMAGYKPDQVRSLYGEILHRMTALPGVQSATLSMTPPLSGMSWTDAATIPGHAPQPNEDMGVSLNSVGPQYFETVGIALLRGRSIGPQDTGDSPRIAVVSQAMADHFFPRANPLGQRLSFSDPDIKGDWEIVGVAKDAKYNSPRETPKRMIYLPVMQQSGQDVFVRSLEVRTVGNPARVAGEVRRALGEIDSNLPLVSVITINEWVDHFLSREQLVSNLTSFFSLLALLLACIGLYGVMSYNVVRRTNEIGIRIALGAETGGVLWLVLKESLLLLGAGVVVGVPVALAAMRLVRNQLFGLSPSDPITLCGAILLIGLVTMLAGYLPARRATKVDPMVALRYE